MLISSPVLRSLLQPEVPLFRLTSPTAQEWLSLFRHFFLCWEYMRKHKARSCRKISDSGSSSCSSAAGKEGVMNHTTARQGQCWQGAAVSDRLGSRDKGRAQQLCSSFLRPFSSQEKTRVKAACPTDRDFTKEVAPTQPYSPHPEYLKQKITWRALGCWHGRTVQQ